MNVLQRDCRSACADVRANNAVCAMKIHIAMDTQKAAATGVDLTHLAKAVQIVGRHFASVNLDLNAAPFKAHQWHRHAHSTDRCGRSRIHANSAFHMSVTPATNHTVLATVGAAFPARSGGSSLARPTTHVLPARLE